MDALGEDLSLSEYSAWRPSACARAPTRGELVLRGLAVLDLASGQGARLRASPGRTEVSGPSELADVLARVVVPHLDVRDAEGLRRLLGHGLATPSVSELREARLGLLADLMAERTGEVPRTEDYEAARAERVKSGEHWPAHSTLLRVHADWLGAVRAAMAFERWEARRGTPPPVKRTPPYTREEAAEAVISCCRAIATWPTESEYGRYRDLARTSARRAGVSMPRLPSSDAMRRRFGGFETVLRRARQR